MINKRWITLPVVYSRHFVSKAVFERFWMNLSSALTVLYNRETRVETLFWKRSSAGAKYGRSFVRYLRTRCFCIRKLTRSLRSLVQLVRKHHARTPWSIVLYAVNNEFRYPKAASAPKSNEGYNVIASLRHISGVFILYSSQETSECCVVAQLVPFCVHSVFTPNQYHANDLKCKNVHYFALHGNLLTFLVWRIAVIAVISGFTCKRGERVNSALYWAFRLVCVDF